MLNDRNWAEAEWQALVDCGPSNGRRPLLPEDMVSNHAEPDKEAQRRANAKKGHVYGNGSCSASTIGLVAHV